MSKLKKKTVIPILFLVILISVYYFLGDYIRNMIIPIYKTVDRAENIGKFKSKYNSEDIVGWLKVSGTNIDYPIIIFDVPNYERDEYREFDYVWVNSNIDRNLNYIPIFGHNVRNVSSNPIVGDSSMVRFEQLMSFFYYDFAKDNKYFQVTIGDKNYLYQIFSVSIVDDGDIEYYSENFSKEKMKKYIKKSIDDSYFKYDVDVTENDSIVSLITCTRFNGKLSNDFKIDGKLVKNKNIGYNYDIDKKDKGKREKSIEGDVNDV